MNGTDAASSAMIRPVAFVAHAAVGSQGVDAASVSAQVRDRIALVDIYRNKVS